MTAEISPRSWAGFVRSSRKQWELRRLRNTVRRKDNEAMANPLRDMSLIMQVLLALAITWCWWW